MIKLFKVEMPCTTILFEEGPRVQANITLSESDGVVDVNIEITSNLYVQFDVIEEDLLVIPNSDRRMFLQLSEEEFTEENLEAYIRENILNVLHEDDEDDDDDDYNGFRW